MLSNIGTHIEVPARVGGVDLSNNYDAMRAFLMCPRPCGRGGFKLSHLSQSISSASPRPCGRGGFKQTYILYEK